MTKRQRQTIQWPKDKDRQYNGQKTKTDNTMAKRKRTKISTNDVEITNGTQKTEDQATRSPLKTQVLRRVSNSCSICDIRRVLLL